MAVQVVIPKEGAGDTCFVGSWNFKVGDRVKAGDVLCEIETDKSVFELESPAAGTILDIFYGSGEEAPALAVVAVIGEPGEAYGKAEAIKGNTEEPEHIAEAAAPREAAGAGKKLSSPRARRLAMEKGVPLDMVPGSGAGGSVVERDVLGWLGAAGQPGVHEIEMSAIRKTTAERMLASVSTTAQYTLHTSANADKLLELRVRFKSSPEELGLRSISINDILLFTVSRVLCSFKELNCHLAGGKLLQFEDVHLAFAVDTPRGLVVPVIKKAGRLGLREISSEAARLAEACRSGRAQADELNGGTFTVSNLGSLGIDAFTPILNPPQVAVLGIGRIHLKPVKEGGQVVFANHLPLSLTLDHQAVDGAAGARFLSALAAMLQNLTDPLAESR